MSRADRVVLVVMAGLLVGSCGTSTPGAAGPSEAGDASKVGMCTILTREELRKLGIRLDTRREVDKLGVAGCDWLGEPIRLSLERDESTIAEYVKRRDEPVFYGFRENKVNGRPGVQFSVTSTGEQCEQLMDGGPVSISVSVAAASSLGAPIDPCAEALRIAEMIEPRLPEAGT